MSSTPTTLKTPAAKLSRAQIYAEFRFMHSLVGGKQNVANLDKLYEYNDLDFTKAHVFLDCVSRYAELEQEISRRRRAKQAAWQQYVNRGAHATARLEQLAHFPGVQHGV